MSEKKEIRKLYHVVCCCDGWRINDDITILGFHPFDSQKTAECWCEVFNASYYDGFDNGYNDGECLQKVEKKFYTLSIDGNWHIISNLHKLIPFPVVPSISKDEAEFFSDIANQAYQKGYEKGYQSYQNENKDKTRI